MVHALHDGQPLESDDSVQGTPHVRRRPSRAVSSPSVSGSDASPLVQRAELPKLRHRLTQGSLRIDTSKTSEDLDDEGASPTNGQPKRTLTFRAAAHATIFRERAFAVLRHLRRADSAEPECLQDELEAPASLWRQRSGAEKPEPPVFTEICADGGTTSCCVVSSNSDPGQLIDSVILGLWGLHPPELLVSVMGGAGKMDINKDRFDIDAFNKGLVEACLRTGAWVVTGGTCSGVMQLVGKAMKKYDKQRQVPCIGIASYGALTSQWRNLFKPGRRYVDAIDKDKDRLEKDGDVPLAHPDVRHTHSILIDSDITGKLAYGKETEFRGRLETCLCRGHFDPVAEKEAPLSPTAMKKSGFNFNINPMDQFQHDASASACVMILVNGGKYSLTAVADAVCRDCPVVVCRGSGRAADAIAELLEQKRMGGLDPAGDGLGWSLALQHLSGETLGEADFDLLRTIIESNLVQVYQTSERFEDVVLQAVLGTAEVQNDISNTMHQLTLAVRWRCCDKYGFLCRQVVRASADHRQAITHILKKLVAQFASRPGGANSAALTETGRNVIWRPRPRHTSTASHHRKEYDTGPVLVWLLDNLRKHVERFPVDSSTLGELAWAPLNWQRSGFKSLEGLALWFAEQEAPTAVLDACWLQMQDAVHAGLVISAACRHWAEKALATGSYTDGLASQRLNSMGSRYERLAMHLVEALARTAGVNPVDLLFEETDRWPDNATCFHLAHNLECKQFVTADFYKQAVDLYWMTPVPFATHKPQLDARCLSGMALLKMPFLFAQDRAAASEFYSVPYVKRYTHGASRFLFITLYAYCVFSGQMHRFCASMIMLVAWALGFAAGEVKQYLLRGSFADYIGDFWNCLDSLHLSVLLIGVMVGWWLQLSTGGRWHHELEVIHALNLLPSFMRLLQSFQQTEYFGTLLMTVLGMCRDALYFFVLLGTFCFGFSCALTPILFPSPAERWNQGLTWALWTIFGDMNDNAMEKAASLQPWPLQAVVTALLYMLALVSNVLLVNLLIAVMNNTYEENMAASQAKWAFYRVIAVLEFDEVDNLPPPLNLLEWLLLQPPVAKDEHEDEQSRRRRRHKRITSNRNSREVREAKKEALDAVDGSSVRDEAQELERLREQNEMLRCKVADLLDKIGALEPGSPSSDSGSPKEPVSCRSLVKSSPRTRMSFAIQEE